jgi:hypothetical protein
VHAARRQHTKEHLNASGAEPVGSSAAEFSTHSEAEIVK